MKRCFLREQNHRSQANSAFRAKHICNYTMEKALASRPIEEATLARAERRFRYNVGVQQPGTNFITFSHIILVQTTNKIH